MAGKQVQEIEEKDATQVVTKVSKKNFEHNEFVYPHKSGIKKPTPKFNAHEVRLGNYKEN